MSAKENINPQRGRPKSESYQNECCRVCKKSLRLTYGTQLSFKSYTNLFKPSRRKESFGEVIAERLKSVGIAIEQSPSSSQVACSPCARKLRNLADTYKLVSTAVNHDVNVKVSSDSGKRKVSEAVTPERASPVRIKHSRKFSPGPKSLATKSSRKSLFVVDENEHARGRDATNRQQSNEDTLLSKLNIDDLDTSKSSQLKIVIAYPSGHVVVVKSNFDPEVKLLLMNLCLSRWSTAVDKLFRHDELLRELLAQLSARTKHEFKCYSNFDSCLKFTTPDQLAAYSNKLLCKEVSMECPIYNAIVTGACNASSSCNEIATTNAIALATSAIARVVNPTMSAVAYRISTVLFHSGISHVDVQRLNRLGICMSSDSVINMHEKMGENFDYAAKKWKKEIEENNYTLLFIKEIEGKMLNRSDDDMHLDMTLNLDEDSLKVLKYYTLEVYNRALQLLESERQSMGEDTLNDDVLMAVKARLQNAKLPTYKIVSDNIDHEVYARIQTKDHNNLSIHWTHQYAVRDKVVNPTLETSAPQVDPDDLQLSALLPDRGVQQNMVNQWAVFVSRIVTKYIPAFQNFQKDVIWHIPHEFSREMSKKSDMCSLGMEFHNPNVAAEMAQILKSYQENYVPCLNWDDEQTFLSKVPVHGDQLFEERERNVKWTFRDGESEYDRLEGLLSEHADWHAKVTLYKTEFDMFTKEESAAEIGTSRASMNRCGKTNAAKGVHGHYNEYKDFHSREVEAHVCASFMDMCGMVNIEDVPACNFPDKDADQHARSSWLIEICKKHVETYVVSSGVSNLVEETGVLDEKLNQKKFPCRSPGCNNTYTLHSRRVRETNILSVGTDYDFKRFFQEQFLFYNSKCSFICCSS